MSTGARRSLRTFARESWWPVPLFIHRQLGLELRDKTFDYAKEQAMIDPNDAKKSADGQGSKRRRTRIYSDRVTVSLRMAPELRQRMMDLCDELQTPANTYILGLIESDLKKKK